MFNRLYPFLFVIFFFSGANGLIFEIVFRRQLHLALGITHYSVGTVLTIFMAGLGIGSIIFGKLADRTSKLLGVYGILELGIGLCGIILTGLLRYLDSLYVWFISAFSSPASQSIVVKILLSCIFLLPPTVLMGGTLPVLGKAVSRPNMRSGAPLGLLYGLNTLGGVLGTLVVTFFLLGTLGTKATLLVFSFVAMAIGIFVLVLSVRTKYPLQDKREHKSEDGTTPVVFSGSHLFIMFTAFVVAGFVGLSVEVYWTRILAYVIGSHGYAFGIILASFLSGLAVGSIAASRVVDRVKHPMDWLGISEYSIGIAVLVTSLLLFRMRGFAGALSLRMAGSWQKFITLEMIILFFILLFPTFLMGTVFPLIMTVLSQRFRMLGRFIGRGYALNTLGSILGASLASFVLIEIFGISFGIKLSSVLALGMGIVIFASRQGFRRRVPAAVAGCALAALVVLFPLHHPLQQLGPGERLIFYREASSATVSVREDAEGGRILSINGLDEVPVDPSSILTFRVLAHMPLLLHPDPRQVMVLSLGGAITTSSVATHDVERVDAVELCPPVVEAAELFSNWNRDVLRDPRLRIVLQDGRNYLLTADTRYDVITADATHPWSADSWILYTREFYELVLSSLDANGIFCQWLPLHYLSPKDFKCILRTMRTVFAHLSVWYTGSYVIVLGQEHAPLLDTGMIEKRMKQTRVGKDLISAGIDSAPALISLHLLSDEHVDRFVGEGPLNTDDRAYLEHSAARCFGVETTPVNLSALNNVRQIPSFVAETGAQKEAIEQLFLARKEMIRGRISTYRGEFESAISSYKYALEIFPEDELSRIFFEDAQKTLASSLATRGDEYRRSGEADKAREAYRNALWIDPEEPHAHNGMGLLLFYEGNYLEALSHYDSALERMPYQAFIRYNKVLALLKSGRTVEAEKEIEIIEKLEKNMDRVISRDLRKYLAEVKAAL